MVCMHAEATRIIDGRGSFRVILVSEYFSHLDEVGTPGIWIIEAQLYCSIIILKPGMYS